MRLSALDVRFLSLSGAKLTAKPVEGYISLLCPKCFIANTSSNLNHWHATGKSIEDVSPHPNPAGVKANFFRRLPSDVPSDSPLPSDATPSVE
jgi:hypothetical protein